MNVKKSLESKIRGWLPQEVIIPKVSAINIEPLEDVRKVRYKVKLAILSLLLVTSAIPFAIFLFHTSYSQFYLKSLLVGTAFVNINIQMGFLEIVSKTITLIPLKITFLELSVYITSAAIFFLSLILIAKILYKTKIKR
jgi:hypothetical protein